MMTLDRHCTAFTLLALAAASLAACGGDNTGSTTDTSTTAAGGLAGAAGTGGTGAGGAAGSTASAGSAGTAGNAGSAGSAGSAGAGGAPPECGTLLPGPIDPVQVINVFNGSEDIAFDGKGHIAGKNGMDILLSDVGGQTTMLATGVPQAYGLRYRKDGFLVVALPNNQKVVEVSPQGMISDLALGLNGPNGLYPDLDGNVWMTELGGSKVSRINPDKTVTVIVSGPDAGGANGIVFDAGRKLLYYTDYGQGRILRVDMNAGADLTPVEVIQIPNTKLDGMVMDACGNLYVVDQSNADMYRVKLDAAGGAAGLAELMASFPKSVANAQFGSGAGFDPKTLYVAGNPGVVFSLAVGVPGAPVPTPP